MRSAFCFVAIGGLLFPAAIAWTTCEAPVDGVARTAAGVSGDAMPHLPVPRPAMHAARAPWTNL